MHEDSFICVARMLREVDKTATVVCFHPAVAFGIGLSLPPLERALMLEWTEDGPVAAVNFCGTIQQ